MYETKRNGNTTGTFRVIIPLINLHITPLVRDFPSKHFFFYKYTLNCIKHTLFVYRREKTRSYNRKRNIFLFYYNLIRKILFITLPEIFIIIIIIISSYFTVCINIIISNIAYNLNRSVTVRINVCYI